MKTRVLIVLGFLGAILAGAVLLMLPVSSPSHTWMKPLDALFTACSAVCITGLTVIDVGVQLSRFGHCVLLALVQLGCVGIMTVGTLFLAMIGRRLSLEGECSLMSTYGFRGVDGWRGLVIWVVLSMAVVEGVATFTFHSLVPDMTWFRAYFYSVMSFCNAGFSLDPGSIAVFQGRPAVLLSMAGFVILGGVGFPVVYNLCTVQFWRRNLVKRGRLTLHTRVVLLSSAIFLAGMFGFFLALEWNRALEPYSLAEKGAIAFFQAVTPRTCGFTVIPVHEMHAATRFVSELLMFIGAAPGGAGGGIKVTTFVVFLVTLLAICRGRRDTVLFRRSIPDTVVREAIVIVMVFAAVISLAMTVLLVSEGGNEKLTFEYLLFETVSAVTTTGLSCGSTTASLSTTGRFVIMLCMLCGRLGAIGVVMLIGGQEERVSIRYPREDLVVG